MELDIKANRSASKWTRKEQAGRILWSVCQPLFRFSPHPFWGWRCLLLKIFGAKIGQNVRVDRRCHVEIPWHLEIEDDAAVGRGVILYSFGHICIGRAATVSQYSHLCAGTHDYTDPAMPLIKPPITIAAQAWVCAGAFIGPGVTVGEGAVVAACAVVVKDVPVRTVVGGNPAKYIKNREKK